MHRARSRAPRTSPLPFLRRRHPFLAVLARWPVFLRWLHPDVTSLPRRPQAARRRMA